MFEKLLISLGRGGAAPPIPASFTLSHDDHDSAEPALLDEEEAFHSIAGLACFIDYADTDGVCTKRRITCRTYEVRGGRASICAICHMRNAYRRFRMDRIEMVYDAVTGRELGSGDYFFRAYTPDVNAEGPPTWGLIPSRRHTLAAGLNILVFMARCDGEWHPLETPVFNDFIDDLWHSKGWPGEAPMCDIMDHAQSLAPDAETFFTALKAYARSNSSMQIVLNATSKLIAADGVFAPEEFDWAMAMKDALAEAQGA